MGNDLKLSGSEILRPPMIALRVVMKEERRAQCSYCPEIAGRYPAILPKATESFQNDVPAVTMCYDMRFAPFGVLSRDKAREFDRRFGSRNPRVGAAPVKEIGVMIEI